MKKKALLIEGWGLNKDPQLKSLIESRRCQVDSYDLDDTSDAPKFSSYPLIFCSGPLGSAFADGLLTLRLSLKLRDILKKQQFVPKSDTHIYASGKAALALLGTGIWGDFSQKTLNVRQLSATSPWRKCLVPHLLDDPIFGAQVCQDAWDPSSPFFEGLSTWATSLGVGCGWVVDGNLYFSEVDFLAMKEVSLLPDYGYFDSSKVSTAGHFLDKLL